MKRTLFILFIIVLLQFDVLAQLNTIDRFGKMTRSVITESEKLKKIDSSIFNPELSSGQIITTQAHRSSTLNNSPKKLYPPLKKVIPTSHFGWRKHPVTGDMKFHTGIDLKAYYEPVYCIADGVVSFAGNGAIEGNYIIINHGSVSTMYCHLSKLLCAAGDIIKSGKVLGISGNTGRSTGPHLHFAVKWESERVNPVQLLKLIGL